MRRRFFGVPRCSSLTARITSTASGPSIHPDSGPARLTARDDRKYPCSALPPSTVTSEADSVFRSSTSYRSGRCPDKASTKGGSQPSHETARSGARATSAVASSHGFARGWVSSSSPPPGTPGPSRGEVYDEFPATDRSPGDRHRERHANRIANRVALLKGAQRRLQNVSMTAVCW